MDSPTTLLLFFFGGGGGAGDGARIVALSGSIDFGYLTRASLVGSGLTPHPCTDRSFVLSPDFSHGITQVSSSTIERCRPKILA